MRKKSGPTVPELDSVAGIALKRGGLEGILDQHRPRMWSPGAGDHSSSDGSNEAIGIPLPSSIHTGMAQSGSFWKCVFRFTVSQWWQNLSTLINRWKSFLAYQKTKILTLKILYCPALLGSKIQVVIKTCTKVSDYRVQEVFLIHRETGLTISHLSRTNALLTDKHAVSSMLLAIQLYIKDSLGLDKDQPLRSAELADRTLWVTPGDKAMLACVITGKPPDELRNELLQIVTAIHRDHHRLLADYHGQELDCSPLMPLLGSALKEGVGEQQISRHVFRRWLLRSAISLSLVIVLLLHWANYRDQVFEQTIVDQLASSEHLYINHHGMVGNMLVISGLKDTDAIQTDQLLPARQLLKRKVMLDFEYTFLPLLPSSFLSTSGPESSQKWADQAAQGELICHRVLGPGEYHFDSDVWVYKQESLFE